MLKRLFLAGLLSLVTTAAFAAGTIPGFSLQQQFDSLGHPLANCQFYTIQAGTTSTPQSAYQDTALTLPLPNPQTCDAAGRLPQMFVADGLIKIRLTDRVGVTQVVADNVLVIGPSGGGGGGGTVDPTTILATGDIKVAYGTSVLSGWVRANGRTIGSATSGASERANLDCQALFLYLWGADANLVVSGGRGASAAADWAANKTIALPDLRGRVIAGMDSMGASASGRLGSGAGSFGANNNTLGAGGGAETHTLTLSQIPTGITVAGTVTVYMNGNSGYYLPYSTLNNWSTAPGTSSGSLFYPNTGAVNTLASSNTFSGSNSMTSNNTSGAAHDTMPPAMLATYYVKL